MPVLETSVGIKLSFSVESTTNGLVAVFVPTGILEIHRGSRHAVRGVSRVQRSSTIFPAATLPKAFELH